MDTIPEDLVALVSIGNDPDIEPFLPPAEIRAFILAAAAGDEIAPDLAAWIETQRGLQAEAAYEVERLRSTGELDDPAMRGLPGWIIQDWAPLL